MSRGYFPSGPGAGGDVVCSMTYGFDGCIEMAESVLWSLRVEPGASCEVVTVGSGTVSSLELAVCSVSVDGWSACAPFDRCSLSGAPYAAPLYCCGSSFVAWVPTDPSVAVTFDAVVVLFVGECQLYAPDVVLNVVWCTEHLTDCGTNLDLFRWYVGSYLSCAPWRW